MDGENRKRGTAEVDKLRMMLIVREKLPYLCFGGQFGFSSSSCEPERVERSCRRKRKKWCFAAARVEEENGGVKRWGVSCY